MHFTRLLVNFSSLHMMVVDLALVIFITCLLFFHLDVMLVTSLRDGLNLVSHEFVASQESKKGVLILSEVI